jgi:type IV pilus biogenesis protein CpaD/CtpE
VDYQVVKDAGQTRRGVLTYMAETAVPPRDCAPMLGYNGTDNRAALEDYKFGCESKTALSRMVVQPSDLMGHAGTAQNESRREGAVTENYKSGKPNEPLKNAYTASTVGSSGG